MKSLGNLTGLVILALFVYAFLQCPFSNVLVMAGAGLVAYGLSRSEELTIVVLLLVLASQKLMRPRNFGSIQSPMAGSEGFQVKDPLSIHTRIETVRNEGPLKPKVANVTGVLESASILDNAPLMGMQELANEALPGSSIPASAKARVLIYPPTEGFASPANASVEIPVKQNPVLQEGSDYEGEQVALLPKGTDMPGPDVASAEVAGAASGAAPPF
jgi:hypothetical protein